MKLNPNQAWKLPLTLHPAQAEIYRDPARFKVLVNGRRFGKSTFMAISAVLAALTYNERYPESPLKELAKTGSPLPEILLVGPTLSMAKTTLWKPLMNMLRDSPCVEQVNLSELTITFKDNLYPPITVGSAVDDGGSKLRGKKVLFACCDEVQLWPRESIHEVLLPAMLDSKGSRAMFAGTPAGFDNLLYELFEKGKGDDEQWQSFNFPTISNPYIDVDELARKKLTTEPRVYEAEYLAQFVSVPGQFLTEFELSRNVVYEKPTASARRPVRYFIGVDPGSINLAMVLVANVVDEETFDDYFCCVDSWYPSDGRTPVMEQRALEQAWRWVEQYGAANFQGVYVDPSRPDLALSWRRNGGYDFFRKTKGAVNSFMPGVQLLNQLCYQGRLRIATEAGSHQDELVAELRNWRRELGPDGAPMENVEARGQKTHRIDCIRYILASLAFRDGDDEKVRNGIWFQAMPQERRLELAVRHYGREPMEVMTKLPGVPDVHTEQVEVLPEPFHNKGQLKQSALYFLK